MNFDPIFRQQVETSLTPERMAKVAASLTAKHTALIIVDMQDKFCTNEETQNLAQHINRLIPAFKAAGMKPYFVYSHAYFPLQRNDTGLIVSMSDTDELVHKRMDSAFNLTELKAKLDQQGIKNVIISGVNLSACVKETAIDSCKENFNTVVLADLVGNNKNNEHLKKIEAFEDMAEQGVAFSSSTAILKKFKIEV